VFEDKLFLVGYILDKRFGLKHLDDGQKEAAFKYLRNMMLEVQQADRQDVSGAVSEPQLQADVAPPVHKKHKGGLHSALSSDDDDDRSNDRHTVDMMACDHQIAHFKSIEGIQVDSDPLTVFQVYHDSIPLICQVMMRVFCVPGAQIQTERLFSIAGFVMSKLRAKLTPHLVESLALLKVNEQFYDEQLEIMLSNGSRHRDVFSAKK
jgi:hypothetical protein